MFIKKKDLVGKRFGSLIVEKPTYFRKERYVIWRCICDCGNIIMVAGDKLEKGTVASCDRCNPRRTKMKMGKLIEIEGETKTLGEWLKKFDVLPGTFFARVKRGMSLEKAIMMPTMPIGRKRLEETTVAGKII